MGVVAFVFLCAFCLIFAVGCSAPADQVDQNDDTASFESVSDVPQGNLTEQEKPAMQDEASTKNAEPSASASSPSLEELRSKLNMSEDYRIGFVHGEKGPEHQKYIVLHDTEGDADAASVIDYWDSNGALVAAHFVVNKDGSIVQCVPLDKIAHHVGFGDTGHNELYGVEDESRDDRAGTVPIGDWAADYGMNSYSIGIELVHVGGSGDYPIEQLEALDSLIAYIDAYFGFESEIIDHKAWRSGNSDTSEEFATYLENYKTDRSYRL